LYCFTVLLLILSAQHRYPWTWLTLLCPQGEQLLCVARSPRMNGAQHTALTPWELSKLDAMGYACLKRPPHNVHQHLSLVSCRSHANQPARHATNVIEHRRKALIQASLLMPTKGPQTAAIMAQGSMQMTISSRYCSVVQQWLSTHAC